MPAGREKLREASQRASARLEQWSMRRWFQVALATGLALLHLFAFAQAGQSRLQVPFNTNPGEHIQYVDPMAPSLGPFPRQPPHWSRLIVSRFDTQHYVGFALRGLSSCPTDPTKTDGWGYLNCGLGWLPAYGTVGGLVSSATGMEPDVALTVMAVLAAIILNLLWICPTMVKRMGRFEAFAILIAWNCYPSAWTLVAPMTESAVLALAIGGFVMLCNERWVWSALLVGACTALRLPTASFAFALGCCLLYAAWERRRAGTAQWWRPLLAVPFCGWGQFLTMAVFQIKLGNWHAFFDARFAFGDHNRLGRLIEPTYYVKGFQSQCADMVIYLGMIAVMIVTWRRVLSKLNRVETMFIVVSSLTTAVLAVAAAMQYWGITRYMLLCPLAFMGMGTVARQHRVLFVMLLAVWVGFYWHLELCSYVTQGDPKLCPCLGRIELHIPWQS